MSGGQGKQVKYGNQSGLRYGVPRVVTVTSNTKLAATDRTVLAIIGNADVGLELPPAGIIDLGDEVRVSVVGGPGLVAGVAVNVSASPSDPPNSINGVADFIGLTVNEALTLVRVGTGWAVLSRGSLGAGGQEITPYFVGPMGPYTSVRAAVIDAGSEATPASPKLVLVTPGQYSEDAIIEIPNNVVIASTHVLQVDPFWYGEDPIGDEDTVIQANWSTDWSINGGSSALIGLTLVPRVGTVPLLTHTSQNYDSLYVVRCHLVNAEVPGFGPVNLETHLVRVTDGEVDFDSCWIVANTNWAVSDSHLVYSEDYVNLRDTTVVGQSGVARALASSDTGNVTMTGGHVHAGLSIAGSAVLEGGVYIANGYISVSDYMLVEQCVGHNLQGISNDLDAGQGWVEIGGECGGAWLSKYNPAPPSGGTVWFYRARMVSDEMRHLTWLELQNSGPIPVTSIGRVVALTGLSDPATVEIDSDIPVGVTIELVSRSEGDRIIQASNSPTGKIDGQNSFTMAPWSRLVLYRTGFNQWTTISYEVLLQSGVASKFTHIPRTHLDAAFPTNNDDRSLGYRRGDFWLQTGDGVLHVCVVDTVANATWTAL